MTSIDDIKAKLDTFSPAKIKFVANVVSALANPPRANIRSENTWLTAWPDWIEYFGLALSVHHGTTPEPLGLTAFETVFRNACRSVDWDVQWSGGPTHRFADLQVTLPGLAAKQLSLKSTAAKGLSRRFAHISKLTEAAWIQDYEGCSWSIATQWTQSSCCAHSEKSQLTCRSGTNCWKCRPPSSRQSSPHPWTCFNEERR